MNEKSHVVIIIDPLNFHFFSRFFFVRKYHKLNRSTFNQTRSPHKAKQKHFNVIPISKKYICMRNDCHVSSAGENDCMINYSLTYKASTKLVTQDFCCIFQILIWLMRHVKITGDKLFGNLYWSSEWDKKEYGGGESSVIWETRGNIEQW